MKDDFSLPVPTLRRAPFRHRSSTVHSTVHTTVQTHATDSSGRWLIRWRESRSASAQPVPARRSPVDDSASPACCAANRDVLLRSASRRKFASKLFRVSIQGAGLQSERLRRPASLSSERGCPQIDACELRFPFKMEFPRWTKEDRSLFVPCHRFRDDRSSAIS